MGNSVIYLIPLLVGGMVSDRGFSELQAGFMASAELGGYAIATFLTALLLDRLPWRRMAFTGLFVMIVANFATTFIHYAQAFAVARIASGLGSGILAALASVAVGQTEQPERNYGILVASSLLYGTAALWGLPVLLMRYGLNSAYWLLVALATTVLFFVSSMPAGRTARPEGPAATGRAGRWLLSAAVLVSILLFWADQNDVYAYIERIGNASGISAEFIGFSLGVANLTGFAGASLIAALGARAGRLLPIVVATAINLACLAILGQSVGPWTYLIALGAMSLSWNVVNPLQLGILAGVDPTGKALALAATVTGAGLAIGPAIGAIAIGIGGYVEVLWAAGALAIVSVPLMLPAVRACVRHEPTDTKCAAGKGA